MPVLSMKRFGLAHATSAISIVLSAACSRALPSESASDLASPTASSATANLGPALPSASGALHASDSKRSLNVRGAPVESETGARELARAAEARLRLAPVDDVEANLALLNEPNRYLRAGVLLRLAKSARALPSSSLAGVVALLADHGRLMSEPCLDSERAALNTTAQGLILHAAECERYQSTTVAERAHAVLLAADPGALAPALVSGIAKRKRLRTASISVVAVRARELSVPLQTELVRALRTPAPSIQHRDAALELLRNVAPGGAQPECVAQLRELAGESDERLAVRATAVLLLLAHGEPQALTASQRTVAQDFLRVRLRPGREKNCQPGATCLSASAVLYELRSMRRAAAALLGELRQLLDSDEDGIRHGALAVLEAMGTAARPAIPRVLALMEEPQLAARDDSSVEVELGLKVLASAKPTSPRAVRAVVHLVDVNDAYLGDAMVALAAMKAKLGARARRTLRRAYDTQCEEAGAVAFFSLSRDDRCASMGEQLGSLGLAVD